MATCSALTFEVIDGRTIGRLVGELDIAQRVALQRGLESFEGDVVVDLVGVSFIGSSGFSALNELRRRLEADGGSFRLRGANPLVTRVVEILGLDDWLER